MTQTLLQPTVAVALGGGGARGLAHIALLEVLDDMGIRPVAIAGTSIGAIIGAGYAAGLSGTELRAYLMHLLLDRSDIAARLLKARIGRFSDLFSGSLGNPVLVDSELLLEQFLPKQLPRYFEDLSIQLTVLATDYFGRCEAAFSTGPLFPALAGSMAIPGLVKPVECQGKLLIDGGSTNPLPFDYLRGKAHIIIACDVAGGPAAPVKGVPKPLAVMFGMGQIMTYAITQQMLRVSSPDVLIRPPVESYRILDFFKASQIFKAADAVKDDMRAQIEKKIRALAR